MAESKEKCLFGRSADTDVKIDRTKKSVLTGKTFYIFAFLAPIVILLTAYAIFGIYPIKDKSPLVLDLNDQYVNYYEHLRDVFHGNGSPFISWSRNLSGETVGMFAYYLSSPFMLIPLLLPRTMMQESVLIMQLLKLGTASVSFCFYLKNSKNVTRSTAVIFSTSYGLMSYAIVELMDPMWLDGLIWLPMICYGIERLVDKDKCFLFVFSLAVMFISNFYIGWMTALFSCLYFLAYFFALSERAAELKRFLIQGGKFALSGILAAVCSACLLIPSYFSLSLGKFDFSEPDSGRIVNFNIFSFFEDLFPNTYDSVRNGGSPMMYCGILTLVLVPLYFMNKDTSLKKKIGYGLLLTVLTVSMWIYPLDIVWHGFQEPNWHNYRYSFLVSFLLLVMSAQMFENMQNVSIRKFLCVVFVLSVYIILMYFSFRTTVIDDTLGYEVKDKIRLNATVHFTIILFLVYAAVFFLHKKGEKARHIHLKTALILCFEMVFTVSYNIYKIDDDIMYPIHRVYNGFTALGRDTVQKIGDMDKGVYRMEKNFSRTSNDPMALGYYGISHSSSLLNSDVINFLRNMGYSCGGNCISYKGTTYVTDSILGIKYIMQKEKIDDVPTKDMFGNAVTKTEIYNKLVLENGNEDNMIYVYEDPYALPIGFMADNAIADAELNGWEDPFENQNILLSALLSEEKQNFFKRIEVNEIIAENAEYSEFDGHNKYTAVNKDELASVEFRYTAPSDDMIYMFMPSEYFEDVALLMNGEYIGHYYYNIENMNINTLGRFSAGEDITITANFAYENNDMIFKDNYVYYLDEEKFSNAVDELKKYPLNIEYFKEDHIKGTITSPKDGIMFTSISWEPGWTIFVDGQKTEPVKFADALIGVPIGEGTHNVEMKFFPKGLAEGIILSVIGVIIVIFIGWKEHKKHN